MHQIAALGSGLFRHRQLDADLVEEVRFHIERETEANIAHGMTPEAARRAAILKFGRVNDALDDSREHRAGAGTRQFFRDVGFGTRLLRKAPVFALTGIAVVALGIFATTAIFSVVYGVILKPLPFREPERLVSIWLLRHGERNYPAAADAMALRELPNAFSDVAFFEDENLNLIGECAQGNCDPQRLQAASVSPNLFTVLGVSPALGRAFAPDEKEPGRNRVVLLSDALWRTRFGADPAVVGRLIRLNDAEYTVVGVMPPSFQYPSPDHQAWVPLVLEPGELTRAVTDNYRVVARLAPHATLDQARQAATALSKRLVTSDVDAQGMAVDSMRDDAVRDVRPMLLLLLGSVLFLLLIACVNLSSLFAARATARSTEFALRLALGASRGRLIVQAIAEAMPVLAAGGVIGVVLADWAVHLLATNAPAGLPRVGEIALSAPVLAVSLGLLGVTGLAASVVPAVQLEIGDFSSVMKAGGRTATSGRDRSLLRRVGVAAQFAFALPLLVGASLLIRSAINVAHVDVGFSPERVTTLKFEVSRTRHPSDADVASYYARLLEAVRVIPGVSHAGLVNRIPLAGDQTNTVHFERASGRIDEPSNIDSRTVTPDYFAALGIRLVAGRAFTGDDDADAPPVVVVDDRVARTVWPGESAIGKRVRGPEWRGNQSATVIGVVAHVRTTGLEVDPVPQVYWSDRQWTQDRMVLAVRSANDANVPVAALLQAIHTVDPEQSVYDVRTMRQIVDRAHARRRLTTTLMAGFSALALLMAAVGIYGVVAYGVTQRLREFGIRLALGATPPQLLRLVMSDAARMSLAGAAVGLVLAVAAAGAMESLVYGVAPRDAVSFVIAAALLIAVGCVATFIPARRAVTVDPGSTLRVE